MANRFQNAAGYLCAIFMLAVLPLLFHNAFFDINRVKVAAVCRIVPILGLVFIALHPRINLKTGKYPCVFMALLLFCFIISSARTGFDTAALTGSEGRFAGLWFMTSCALAYFIIAFTPLQVQSTLIPAILAAAFIAVLGTVNALGIDPLRFYVRMKKGQEHVFLGTIGNVNFFGTYLSMILPLSVSYCAFSSAQSTGILCFLSSFTIALGITASRTDVAFLSEQMAYLCLLAFSGNSFQSMSRVLFLWAMSWLTLPIFSALLTFGSFGTALTGLPALLSATHTDWIAFALLAVFSALAYASNRGSRKAPGIRAVSLKCASVFLAVLFIGLLGLFLFTFIWPEADIGPASLFLRFNDHWGSYRGFVYMRSLRAFSNAPIIDKLFGQGLDMAKRILTPYFDKPEFLAGGVFNDAHAQPLQMLITCGVFGACAFLGFYFVSLSASAKHAECSLPLRGITASLVGYLPTMLLSVTQPILIAVYFTLCALALSHIRHLAPEGGLQHES